MATWPPLAPVHGGTEQGQLGMFCQGSESWHKELKEKKRAPTKKGCDELERISFEYNNVIESAHIEV